MLSQQNLIYLGIALLVVGIAFFAYQELQKHHTEIEKLRMQGHELRLQSQKLEKIIHAYNMRQWQQSNEYVNNDNDEHDDDDDSSTTEYSESSSESEEIDTIDREHHTVNALLQQTLNSIGTPARTPTRVTVSAGGKTMQFPVVTPLHSLTPLPPAFQGRNENIEELPNVDSFEVTQSHSTLPTHHSSHNNLLPTQRLVPRSAAQPSDEGAWAEPIVAENNTRYCPPSPSPSPLAPQYTHSPQAPHSPRAPHSHQVAESQQPSKNIENEMHNLQEMEQEDEESMITAKHRKDEKESEENKENQVNESEDSSESSKEESDNFSVQSQQSHQSHQSHQLQHSQNGKTCPVKIKGGDRKGELCGNPIKINGLCLRHFRSENKN